MITFHLNGRPVDRRTALVHLIDMTDQRGRCRNDMAAIWLAAIKPDGAEARDSIMELSDCTLEIIVDA